MLVLARKQGETLLIDDDIRVTIVCVKGNRVKIGIEAPASVTVLRGELEQHLEAPTGTNESAVAGRRLH